MEQATTIIKRTKEKIDDKCNQIIDFMVLLGAFEDNPLRYNELFRIVEKNANMTKPTFNEHLSHLVNAKILKRKQITKQNVRFCLNSQHQEIKKLKEVKEQVDKDTHTLIDKMANANFWVNMPTLLSLFFSICELRRTKILLQSYLEKDNENTLSLLYQAKNQEMLETLLLGNLIDSINKCNSAEKKILQEKVLKTLNDSIVKTQNAFASLLAERHDQEGE